MRSPSGPIAGGLLPRKTRYAPMSRRRRHDADPMQGVPVCVCPMSPT